MSSEWFSLCMGDENLVPHPLIANDDNLFGVDWLDLKTGKAYRNWNPESIFFSDGVQYDGVPDDMLVNAENLPVFSERLRNALARSAVAIQDIQYLPVRVANSEGRQFPGFSIANILTRIPALDREHSFMLDVDETEIDPLTGKATVTGIGKEALRAEVLGNHDIFRLLEYFPPIFVSKRFVDVFSSNNFTGATFYPLQVK